MKDRHGNTICPHCEQLIEDWENSEKWNGDVYHTDCAEYAQFLERIV